jgi:hypothetical protein
MCPITDAHCGHWVRESNASGTDDVSIGAKTFVGSWKNPVSCGRTVPHRRFTSASEPLVKRGESCAVHVVFFALTSVA